MEIRAAGRSCLFGILDNRLFLVDGQDTVFSLSTIADRQISLLKGDDIVFAAFDASGTVLNLVSKTGLLVFLEPVESSSHTISEFFPVDEKYEIVNPRNMHVWFETMRVIWSEGRIVPFRTAIEDQFRFDSRTCPFSTDGLILVPFQIVFDQTFAVVRVQPPDSSSCLVRLAFRVKDSTKDGVKRDTKDTKEEYVTSRQALMHNDWLFIYDMGIIDMKIRAGIVMILTHTCAVELFLADHDPMPIAMSLPRDRIDVIFSEEYMKFSHCYRRYCDFLAKLKVDLAVKPDLSILTPPEWEVVFHGRGMDRDRAIILVQTQERLRPRLKRALREEMHIIADMGCRENEQGEGPKATSTDKMIATVMDFGDTRPSYACPWTELAVTDSMLYLNTFNGVYVCQEEWMPLISAKTGRSVYAVNIFASDRYLFVQEDDDSPWRRFDTIGNEIVYDFTCPLLFATNGKLMTSEFALDDAAEDSVDALSSSPKRSYKINH